MSHSNLHAEWEKVVKLFSNNAKGPISMEGILLLIGIQESSIFKDIYSKEEKIDLIHIGMCNILLKDKYYEFSHHDEEQWIHYKNIKPLPEMNTEEENLFIKEKIIAYCQYNKLIS